MSASTIALLTMALVFVAFTALNLVMARRTQRLQGRPAPDVGGPHGEAISQGDGRLFYFYSPSCGACRKMTPVVKGLASGAKGVVPVDVSQRDQVQLALRFGVMATPTTILVKDGVVQRVLVGAQSERTLMDLAAATA